MSERLCAWRTVHECRGEVHLYLAGYLCEAGAPPKQPTPPSGITRRITTRKAHP